ncbi:OLC1v1034200C1 [Oldenlandia corymbosa var. corymbosa]|uniref:OLC1v1034200C1 n=1 Tax=Oldenlandia corymbosa var. corymbosa TaxID=529605 RepID=A0AAV1CQ26_OLDCO|nr:OLC1v1034200C1 [Oldenlandia corymbosa var. corymbosa]
MPQVDLETLVSALSGGATDRKITCETLADEDMPGEEDDVTEAAAHDVPPDFPPESFWLSKDAELDWYDRNAFLERKESTKGISHSGNLNPNVNPHSNNNSQRFSVNLKTKASLFGLPKTQKPNYVDAKRRCNKPANVKLFPKRSASVGKTAVSLTEPSSPKVSCMGRVRSKRGRRRTSELTSSKSKREKIPQKSRSLDDNKKRKKKGFYSKFFSMFKSGREDRKPLQSEMDLSFEEEKPRKSTAYTTRKMPDVPISVEPAAPEPPALGGMKKFASGRRSTDEFESAEPAVSEPPALGGLKKFASGRKSTDEFDAALNDFVASGWSHR